LKENGSKMNKYKVKFEIYGKIIKVEVKASTEALAKMMVKNDIIFHAIIPATAEMQNDQLEKIKNILGL
jgi:hypothetical protein